MRTFVCARVNTHTHRRARRKGSTSKKSLARARTHARVLSRHQHQHNKMAAQSNPPASFGYTWGFADNSRTDGNVVELPPNMNYTVTEAVSVSVCVCVCPRDIREYVVFFFLLCVT